MKPLTQCLWIRGRKLRVPLSFASSTTVCGRNTPSRCSCKRTLGSLCNKLYQVSWDFRFLPTAQRLPQSYILVIPKFAESAARNLLSFRPPIRFARTYVRAQHLRTNATLYPSPMSSFHTSGFSRMYSPNNKAHSSESRSTTRTPSERSHSSPP